MVFGTFFILSCLHGSFKAETWPLGKEMGDNGYQDVLMSENNRRNGGIKSVRGHYLVSTKSIQLASIKIKKKKGNIGFVLNHSGGMVVVMMKIAYQ